MELYKTLPILHGITKNGKTKVWIAKIYKLDNNIANAHIEHGQLDGKLQLTVREYDKGKNIGKSNETTPLQQCLLETEKKWLDKKDKEGYIIAESDTTKIENNLKCMELQSERNMDPIFPMLANKYDPNSIKKKKNDINFPCYVQPKLDGLRCITYLDNKILKNQSRTGTFFNFLDHINEDLLSILSTFSNIALDGELYTDEIPFEELAGLIKKKKVENIDLDLVKKIKYHIYDIIFINDNTMVYQDRLSFIREHFCNLTYINVVQTELCSDKNKFKEYFSQFINNGYEGIMLRNIDSVYRENYRSNDLQKYKEFMEDEYEIINFKEAEGRDKGTVIWICKTLENREFSVRPRGTVETRKNWFVNGNSYIGKKLTIIYQELSELGVPRFPVGKVIREDF
jgi:DNA ligase-1|uniref:ATP-dependent DNA ligase family profile domain-containing protein n=1 Tax=viral metagenome TaxID=1070528 RepID=A0A6C0CZV1_9ZZZZ